MKLEEVRVLNTLADAKYKARQQLFQALLQRENAVRADLARLEERDRASNQLSNPSMRSIGADVIWRSWLGKAKTSLNMKLALILAEKDQHLRQVRQAYGKVLASEALLRTLSADKETQRRRVALNQAIDMSLVTKKTGRTDLLR